MKWYKNIWLWISVVLIIAFIVIPLCSGYSLGFINGVSFSFEEPYYLLSVAVAIAVAVFTYKIYKKQLDLMEEQKNISKTQTEISEKQTKIMGQQKDFAGTQTSISEIQTDIMEEQKTIVKTQTEIAGIQTDIMEQQNKIALFEKRYNLLKSLQQARYYTSIVLQKCRDEGSDRLIYHDLLNAWLFATKIVLSYEDNYDPEFIEDNKNFIEQNVKEQILYLEMGIYLLDKRDKENVKNAINAYSNLLRYIINSTYYSADFFESKVIDFSNCIEEYLNTKTMEKIENLLKL